MSRYAIYFVPDGPLGDAGAAWLGRDCRMGESSLDVATDRPDLHDWKGHTSSARRYGFHATLKAPMVLPQDTSFQALERALRDFAAAHPPVPIGALSPRWIGHFLALTPDETLPILQAFAFKVVETFDPFRAALDDGEYARRTNGLRDDLIRNVKDWGYPYVGDAFRFHMTLSDAIPDSRRAGWMSAAQDWFTPSLNEPALIKAISICEEPDPPGPFHEVFRCILQA